MALFGKFLDPNSQIWSNIVEILTRGSTLANKNIVWKFLEGFEYLWKMDGPKVNIFGPTLSLLFLLKMVKIEKISSSAEKLQPLSYPNMSKWSLYLLSTFREKYDYFFVIFRIILPANTAGSQIRGVESKFDKYYFFHLIPGQLPVKKL